MTTCATLICGVNRSGVYGNCFRKPWVETNCYRNIRISLYVFLYLRAFVILPAMTVLWRTLGSKAPTWDATGFKAKMIMKIMNYTMKYSTYNIQHFLCSCHIIWDRRNMSCSSICPWYSSSYHPPLYLNLIPRFFSDFIFVKASLCERYLKQN